MSIFNSFFISSSDLAYQAASTMHESFASCAATGLDALRTLEPYQPWIASARIAGKITWQVAQQNILEKETKHLTAHVQLLKVIQKSAPDKNLSLVDRIEKLEEKIRTNQLKLRIHRLGLLQLPALATSHPGNNFWISLYSFSQRTAQISLRSALSEMNRYTLAVDTISILGTCFALGRQTGFIEEENSLAHGFLALAICANILEGAHFIQKSIARKMQDSSHAESNSVATH